MTYVNIHRICQLVCGSILLLQGMSASAAVQVDNAVPLAPGYGPLPYDVPTIGSYELPSLGTASDGAVLGSDGASLDLHAAFENKYVLLSFVYSTCSDINGCPLSSYVFYKIKSEMKKDPQLAAQFKLISLSFDPSRDTPEVMNLYGANFKYAGGAGTWEFLTTKSEAELQPILKNYRQDIQRFLPENGEQGLSFSHTLRVFLIDPQKKIRNIYSVAFLHADLILNDIRTLLAQENRENSASPLVQVSTKYSIPGDDKDGYEKADYVTRTRAVELRRGQSADLMQFIKQPPLGLPSVPIPASNPMSQEKVELGRRLFFDRRLSLNDTFSCAMCHVPEQGFTSNEVTMAVGIEGRSVRRNSPTIYNIAYATRLFHDGREDNLEQQAWGPFLAKNEMGNPSIGAVLSKIRAMPDYDGAFEAVFAGKGPTMETVGQALASYQRTLVSGNSPFDRWRYGQQESAISEAGKRGFSLFKGKAACATCHTIESEYSLFTDNKMHNTGLGYRESMGIRPKTQRILLAPGVYGEIDQSVIDSVSEPPPPDLGLYEITQNPFDRWKYRTPSLRNISLTAPYMHNGTFSTLEEVVRFYNQGGISNEVLDPLIKPLGLSDSEVNDLVAFLQSLTGSNVEVLVSDAFAAPVGDLSKNDPNWVRHTEMEVK